MASQLSCQQKTIHCCGYGTVLGPILALIFLSDIDKDVENIASMFADDTRLMGKVKVEADVESLQSDLDRVYEWADSNNMKFNSTKFEVLRYGKNEEMKCGTMYFSAEDDIIEEKDVLRD